MHRLLVVALLVGFLSACATPSFAQTRGPTPRETPTELWREYPLKQSRAATGKEGNDRPVHQDRRPSRDQGGRSPASRSRGTHEETSDGGIDTKIYLAVALLLLAVSALVVYARRGGIKRLRPSRPALRRAAARPQPVPGPPAQNGPSANVGARFLRMTERVPYRSGRSQTAPAPAGRAPSGVLAESAPVREVAAPAREARSPAPSGARPADAPGQWSRAGQGRDARPSSGPVKQLTLGYASVPDEGDVNGVMRRQQREIEALCERKGLALLKLVRDVETRSSSDLTRPGLEYALKRLAAHDASCMVVSSLERLTHSAANLGTLVEWLDRCGARLVVADIDLDTGTPEGRLGAKALAAVGGSERKTLRQRTRKGLEAARLAQRSSGRAAVIDRAALRERIADMRASGMTLQAIADTLNAEGIPTLRGGVRWRPSSVQSAAGYKRPNRKTRLA
jgi:DNA invertase Pin-like site-specific DNA recombinase